MSMSMTQNIYEGWTPQDFVDELEPIADMIMRGEAITKPFKTKTELADWCADNQPFYKKKIPAVVNYFAKKYGIK